MNDKLITALLAILLALGGWTLQRTFSLSQDMVLIKTKVEMIEDEIQTLKILRARRNARKKRNSKIKWMKYLVSCIIIGLLFLFSVGCNGVKHVISIEEPTDHTSGDDGGKLKYKIIFGDVNQKE